jgi:hypothetical protein
MMIDVDFARDREDIRSFWEVYQHPNFEGDRHGNFLLSCRWLSGLSSGPELSHRSPRHHVGVLLLLVKDVARNFCRRGTTRTSARRRWIITENPGTTPRRSRLRQPAERAAPFPSGSSAAGFRDTSNFVSRQIQHVELRLADAAELIGGGG